MTSTSFTPPASPSPNLQTLLAYFDATKELDVVKIFDLFDDNFQYQTRPKSLGNSVLNKEQYYGLLSGALSQFKAFRVSVTVNLGRVLPRWFDRLLISSLVHLA